MVSEFSNRPTIWEWGCIAGVHLQKPTSTFAHTRPTDTAGIMLIDPSHVDVGRELFALDCENHTRNLDYLQSLKGCLTEKASTAETSSIRARPYVAAGDDIRNLLT